MIIFLLFVYLGIYLNIHFWGYWVLTVLKGIWGFFRVCYSFYKAGEK